MEKLVLVEDLWKIYRVGQVEYPALVGVDATIYSGELLAVVGPSGSGKSTLLHIIAGLDKPTRGKVTVDKVDISKLRPDELAEYRNKKIGVVFQFYNLIPYLTAIENVELPMAISGVETKIRRSKALKILELVGLSEKAKKRPTELSGGEQQRVAIARSLVNEPKLLLADEPTGNIDSASAKAIVDAFVELVHEKGVTVVMVTHNIEITQVCDRVIRLKDGKIVEVQKHSR